MKTLPGFTGYEGPRIGSHFTWRTDVDAKTDPLPAIDPATVPIKIEPIKGDSPNKLIIVNGRAWARTSAQHMSRYGVMYEFEQLATGGSRSTIQIEREGVTARTPSSARYRIPAVRSYSKNPRRNDGDNRPTEQRLIDMARELIAGGHLIHPDEKQRRSEEFREACRAETARAAAARREAFRAKAFEAIGDQATEAQLDRVIAAMEWAQSQ